MGVQGVRHEPRYPTVVQTRTQGPHIEFMSKFLEEGGEDISLAAEPAIILMSTRDFFSHRNLAYQDEAKRGIDRGIT